MALKTNPSVSFHSPDRALTEGFERLKEQALAWVFEGYPVGDYYEAALPGRDAFCMRDVSHQCIGAEVLGLSAHNRNMFRKFGASISPERDFCGYWEIDRFDRPCPVDYTDDTDFWYNLPANFDVLDACLRLYAWTGDAGYLEDPALKQFFAWTMEQYIKAWDGDGDGIPDGSHGRSRRGIASYDESDLARQDYLYGADLLGVMARAHLSYAKMCRLKGRNEYAAIYEKRGQKLLAELNEKWCSAGKGIAAGKSLSGELIFLGGGTDEWNCWAEGQSLLHWDVLTGEEFRRDSLASMAKVMPRVQVEGLSHYPEIFWRYGRREQGMAALHRLYDPSLSRREYPEVSFCGIGSFATGLMGLKAILPEEPGKPGGVATLSGLTEDLSWAQMNRIPVLGGQVSLLQEQEATELAWTGGKPLRWQVRFAGEGELLANGRFLPEAQEPDPYTGERLMAAELVLQPGEALRVEVRR